jgi:glutamate synthase (NADPH/NADH) small chain
VTQIDINPLPGGERPADQPWPTYPKVYRVSTSHEEGGERVYASSTVEFLSDGSAGEGQITHLRLENVDRSSGRAVPIEGTERVVPAQLVLLALGFTGVPRNGLVEQLGLDVDERGRVTRDETFATSVPGVFVAGDAGRGQSLIVWAIAEGRSAASAVDAFLRGDTDLPAPILPSTVSVSA